MYPALFKNLIKALGLTKENKAKQAIIGKGAILQLALSQNRLLEAQGPFCKLNQADKGNHRPGGHFATFALVKEAIIGRGAITNFISEGENIGKYKFLKFTISSHMLISKVIFKIYNSCFFSIPIRNCYFLTKTEWEK